MIRKTFGHVLLAGVLLALTAPARGQAQPTLSQAFEAAWSRAIEAAESAGQARRADAALEAARAPWAAPPSVEIGQWRDRGDPARTRETQAGLVIPLWLPGQRGARIGAATAEGQAARAAMQAARLRVAAEVREAQWDFHMRQADLAAAQAQARAYAGLARDVQRRVAAGDLAHTDGLAAAAELLAAQANSAAAERKVAAALARWRALTGFEEVPPGEAAGDGAAAAPPEPHHPYLLAAQGAARLAQARLDAARRSTREPPELTVGARREAAAPGGAESRGIGVSLRIPLATADRNQPLLAHALSERELAQARERKVQLELETEVQLATATLETARRGLADEERRAALLRERHLLLDRSFRAGNTSLADLLRALAAASQAEADVQQRKAALGLATARLQQALGVLP